MNKNNKKIKKQKQENNDIQIDLKNSQTKNIVKQTTPSKKEEIVDLDQQREDDIRDKEIDQGLTEIYQDDKGQLVDVHKLEKIRRKGFILSIVNFLFFLLIIGGAGYYAYDHWYRNVAPDVNKINFSIVGDQEVLAGETFNYDIKYKNESRTVLKNVRIDVALPDNFIFVSADQEDKTFQGSWSIDNIPAYGEGDLKISGLMIGPVDDTGILSAYLTYSPDGLSSEYKKEAFLTTKIISTGLDINFDYYQTALVGESNELNIGFGAMENNFITNFRISLEPQENITIEDYTVDTNIDNSDKYASYTIDRPGVWEINSVLDTEQILPVRFKINDKLQDKEDLIFHFEKKAEDGQYYNFLDKTITLDVMKNNLNLTMIINGSRQDGGVDFGKTLHYSIVYNNKGDADIKNLVVMAVLEGDYLDWTTLNDQNDGREKGNTITWSQEEVPALAEIKQDEEGTIDFSIKVAEFSMIDLQDSHEISSYARFSVGKDKASPQNKDDDNKSNTIVLKMNSDLSFSEELRYFNEDNISVGSGPNPPQVGEKTSYKVYWKINNNLHELNKLGVTLKLPDYVEFDAKDRATVGSIVYSTETHEVVWNIGRLPTSVYQASAEFNVSITPTEDDKDKIMVILPGSSVQAVDAETKEELAKKSQVKTTKLNDDEIGINNGMIE